MGCYILLKYSPHRWNTSNWNKRHRITLSVEEFGDILNPPHEDTMIEPEDKVNIYNHKLTASSLMKDPLPSIPNPLPFRYILPESHMIHFMVNHMLFIQEKATLAS